MMKRGLPLAELQEVPNRSLILLTGAPGAGKSTFCHQAVLTGLSLDRPVIFVTTEHGPSEVVERLQDRGLGDSPLLHFVDAFGETVGAATLGTADTEHANCEDLNSISMAIARLQESISKSGILLAFDSLTSPYLFSEKEMFRFMRLCLVKFASRGNSVLAVMDEGCGNEEDLVAMMSLADGILRMAAGERERTLDVVKHPLAEPGKVVVPKEPKQPQVALSIEFDPAQLRLFFQSFFKGKANLRK
jgi:KaiC/GvpD/RAD55 family RecA-like ATPase